MQAAELTELDHLIVDCIDMVHRNFHNAFLCTYVLFNSLTQSVQNLSVVQSYILQLLLNLFIIIQHPLW